MATGPDDIIVDSGFRSSRLRPGRERQNATPVLFRREPRSDAGDAPAQVECDSPSRLARGEIDGRGSPDC